MSDGNHAEHSPAAERVGEQATDAREVREVREGMRPLPPFAAVPPEPEGEDIAPPPQD